MGPLLGICQTGFQPPPPFHPHPASSFQGRETRGWMYEWVCHFRLVNVGSNGHRNQLQEILEEVGPVPPPKNPGVIYRISCSWFLRNGSFKAHQIGPANFRGSATHPPPIRAKVARRASFLPAPCPRRQASEKKSSPQL